MYILFGIISSLLAIAEEFILARYLEHTIAGFSFFLIIPMGTFLIGLFIGFMIDKGSILSNKKVKKGQYITSMIIAIITFFGIGFMEYKTTYVTDNYEFNRTGKGNPVSDYIYVDDNGNEQEMTFINYEKYKLDNFDTTINSKHIHNQEVSTHGTKNYIMYFADLIGMVVGALTGVLAFCKNDTYCENCKRYKKTKELFKFSKEEYNKVIPIIENCNINFNELIMRSKVKWTKDKNPIYYRVLLVYCDSCRQAEIWIQEFKAKDNNEIEKNRKYIPLENYSVVQMFA